MRISLTRRLSVAAAATATEAFAATSLRVESQITAHDLPVPR